MNSNVQNKFLPDYAVPPGETLREILEDIPMTQADLARRIGRTPKMINEIIAGKAPITPETALLLEQVLNVPARLWNNLERNYQEDLARIQERKTLSKHIPWLEQVPVRDMVDLGWIPEFKDKIEQLRAILTFFGIATPEQWESQWARPQAAFRQSKAFEANPIAVAAWLRKGEIEAQKLDCAPYEKEKFKSVLLTIRTLTTSSSEVFQAEMIKLCAEAGVALVFVPSVPKIRASGATRWIAPEKALIQLSLRYKKDDQFWFSFFHEAGHIYLHGKREIFIDSGDEVGEKEKEADTFAANQLIPPAKWRKFVNRPRVHYSEAEIVAFAESIGIAPGIVAGRLQREDDRVPYTHFQHLKRTFDWSVDGETASIVEKP